MACGVCALSKNGAALQMCVIESINRCAWNTSYETLRDLCRHLLAPNFEIRLFALSVGFV